MAAILLFLHASCTFFNSFEISSSFSFNLSFSIFNVQTVSFRISTISYSKFIYFCVQLKSFRSCVRSIRTHAHHSSRRFGETWREGTLFTDCQAEMILSTLIGLIQILPSQIFHAQAVVLQLRGIAQTSQCQKQGSIDINILFTIKICLILKILS